MIHISKYRSTFKILLIGQATVGKTALVQRFVHKKFDASYMMTIGMEPLVRYQTIDGVSVCYSLWDIAGQQTFRNLRKIFFKGSNASLIVFDLTNRESFEAVDVWYKDSKDESSDQIFLLIGNKNDLIEKRVVSYEEAYEKAKQLKCVSYIETSAKTGDYVEEAFLLLGRELIKASQQGFSIKS